MTFLNKILPTLGIGGARVDTKPAETEVAAGGELKGEISVYGGRVAQEIKGINLILKAEYIHENDGVPMRNIVDLADLSLENRFLVEAGQEVVLPFVFPIPISAPVSLFEKNVWLHTDLNVMNAVANEDRDFLDIKPHPNMQRALNAFAILGFVLRKIETKNYQYLSKTPDYGQIFVFLPQGEWRKRCEKLKVQFQVEKEGIGFSMRLVGKTEDKVIDNHYFTARELRERLPEQIEVILKSVK